ncbi:MAG: methyltransferase domain-containing protein, partial [Bdellovibrionales bacterium]|nr:methyltransferase domain-containing protein [Bdellovibrionales bacterium]
MEPALQQKLQNILTSQAVETFDKERQMYVVKEFEEGKLKEDPLNRLKTFAKRKLKGLYPALIKVFSPVHGPDPVITFLKERPAERFTTVNLGAGLHAYKDVINVDGTGYSSVHVACDLSSLPFESSSVDSIISVAVLEHVPNPAVHVSEFMRVLKPEGEVLCFIPFMQPFHASPFDYQRYTEPGLR